ncbi:MAG TPA: glycosyltransferase [Ginsengibacter sp.]|nr:glycosyltransferase [Ginsengibacter sp.]
MKEVPLISICIPAYKRVTYLQRLFDSISIQTFKDYEVIVTDDSPDESVGSFVNEFRGIENIRYYKNIKVLGTPENWNESIRKANGEWIKLMHDDDWFADKDSLQIFCEATLKNADCSFFFSAYKNVNKKSNFEQPVYLNWWGDFLLNLNPLNVFKKQFIGAPSSTLIRRNVGLFYDSNFKWVVDFEYYIRCLRKIKKYHYINTILINVGLNEEQVTKYSFRIPEVEIPENQLLIEKLGYNILRNIFVYDYYWRFYRNLEIKSEQQIKKYYAKPLNPLLRQMINFQKKIAPVILRTGLFSKIFMFQNYFLSLFKRIE